MAQVGFTDNNLGFFQAPIVQGQQGSAGQNGANGFSILNGVVNPTVGDGVNGDFFINTVTNFIFGPKTSGAWGSGTSLVGPAGAAADGIILDYQPSVVDTPNTGWETLKTFTLPVIGSGTEGLFRVVLSTGSFAENECNYRFRISDGTLSTSTPAFGAVGMQQHNIELSLVRNGTSLSYIQRGFISSSDFSGFDAPQVRYGALSTLDESLALTVEFQINIAATAVSPTQINAREFQVKLFTVAV
jgi:hypothetical protein